MWENIALLPTNQHFLVNISLFRKYLIANTLKVSQKPKSYYHNTISSHQCVIFQHPKMEKEENISIEKKMQIVSNRDSIITCTFYLYFEMCSMY